MYMKVSQRTRLAPHIAHAAELISNIVSLILDKYRRRYKVRL